MDITKALLDAAIELLKQWQHYRDNTSLNQADAYYSLAKGQWDKWNALAEAIAALSAQGGLTVRMSKEGGE